MKLSVIVPSLDGGIPPSVRALGAAVELVVVRGVSPVAAARNEGLARASGDYVAWVDADDEIASDWLPAITAALSGGPDIVSFDAHVEWCDGSGRAPYRLDGRTAGQLWCKVFRRALFDGLRFVGTVHEDWRIQCEMPKNLRRVHLAKELYVYRRTAKGLSQHRDLRGEIAALWGLVGICDSRAMFRGICERVWDLAKEPARRMLGRGGDGSSRSDSAPGGRGGDGSSRSDSAPSEGEGVSSERGGATPSRPAETWLVDARTFGSRPTGIGMYAKRHLARLMRENPRTRFVLLTDVLEGAAIRELNRQGAEVRVYGKRVFNSVGVIGYFRFVRRVVTETKPDVFWQPNNLQPFRPKGVKRVIVTMHDVFGLRDWSWRYVLWHLYYRFSFRRTLRNVTELWFNSKVTEAEVFAAAGVTARDGVARPLREGVVTKVVYPITEVPRKEEVREYPQERPYFLYLGNIEVRKGADLLIEAYRRYREKEVVPSSIRGGDVASTRADDVADLVFAGIEKNVTVPRTEGITVLGYVDDETKFSLMKSAKALIVPSRAEGYGMQVAEAAAFGTRCLASDLAVFREIDATGRVTFPCGDVAALVELMRRI